MNASIKIDTTETFLFIYVCVCVFLKKLGLNSSLAILRPCYYILTSILTENI